MQFIKIDETPQRATNLSNTGAVYYVRWKDEIDAVYVQIISVAGGYGSGNGTFSPYLFSLDEIAKGNVQIGYDPLDGSAHESRDNNMSGFLRAVSADIDRKATKEKSGNEK